MSVDTSSTDQPDANISPTDIDTVLMASYNLLPLGFNPDQYMKYYFETLIQKISEQKMLKVDICKQQLRRFSSLELYKSLLRHIRAWLVYWGKNICEKTFLKRFVYTLPQGWQTLKEYYHIIGVFHIHLQWLSEEDQTSMENYFIEQIYLIFIL